MSYLGRGLDKISNIEILDNITFDGSSSYSITKSSVAFVPNSAQSCLISIDGVVQATNFTVSTSTIDFGVAIAGTSTCDFFLHYGTGVAFIPTDGSVTSAKLSYPLTTFSSTGIDDNATSKAITIDSSQKVGIGTASPAAKFNVNSGASNTNTIFDSTDATVLNLYRDDTGSAQIASTGGIFTFATGGDTAFASLSEAMRITSDGNVLVGKTTSSTASAGGELANGVGGENAAILVADSQTPLVINRLTNDGVLVSLRQAGTQEGNISVSGTAVSYNGFTGSHWSRFIDESKPDVLRGTVMESLDQMTNWYNAEFEVSTTEQDSDRNDVVKTTTQKEPYALKANEQEGDVITYNFKGTDYQATIVKEVDVKHVMSKISDTSEAKNVYGVFSHWDNDDLINNDFYVASVGSYVVRIKVGQTVSKGDLLQSNGDGTAKVQTDDAVRSSSFAKVLSTTIIETYEDGSYLVPCSLMC
jgi:hypothetical protein